ncbi:SGNH/GDSL hydrolase family protein [Flavobacterium caseinilyticum]|uniref:Acylhydrolase n=1 Tax=Flavobacterium caseinilyticum TaxID=2541732 RepID=A0A4R5ARF7_9FLAO|nr:SGNH/GDSL hydrolase family protein [Flavobacterium caseinilyticum]TDD75521.1 acylhydrolase [Flavobacterium caseinilyticum]
MKGRGNTEDWPNLNRYHNENAALKPAAQKEKRIVFMGDSITEFWSTVHPEFFIGQSYVNRGISGQTTPQMLLRFRADVIALRPNIVIIHAGVNDIAGNTGTMTTEMIRDNIFSMIELANSHDIKVILGSVLPAYDFPWRPNQDPIEKITALNEILKNYAKKNDIVYLDYYSAMADERKGLKSEFSNDGVHPNKAGYQVMMPLAEKAIAMTLLKK